MAIKLTSRDLAVIHSLCRFGYLSFQQIAERHFQGLNKSTIHNRLTLLQKRGLLNRTRVGRLFHHLDRREFGVVFKPTRLAIRTLNTALPEAELKAMPVKISTTNLFHNLVLADVIGCLEKRFIGVEFQIGKAMAPVDFNVGRLPDALIRSPTSIQLAIELELTSKSERRYREILTSYRVNPRVEKILYVCPKGVRDKIIKILAYQPKTGLPRPVTGKFYFADLDELVRRSETAPITNGDAELNIAKCPYEKEST